MIFQITSTLTTISANKRARPTNQVFDGSNNNLFIHSIKKCESKSFHFDFAPLLRTAILSMLSTTLGLSCHWLCRTFGFTRRFPILFRSVEEFSNKCTNMAKSAQLFLVISAILAGLFLEKGLSQRQICSYYGMNFLSSCYGCLAQVSLLHRYNRPLWFESICAQNSQRRRMHFSRFLFSKATKGREI